jgi:hypothetical protein
MSQSRSLDQVEADLIALRAAAERAGTALACLFSSSDEFEAAVIKARRDAGAFRRRADRSPGARVPDDVTAAPLPTAQRWPTA